MPALSPTEEIAVEALKRAIAEYLVSHHDSAGYEAELRTLKLKLRDAEVENGRLRFAARLAAA